MNKEIFKSKVEKVVESNKALCVLVTIPGQDAYEYIINAPESVENKVKYYLQVYNDDMEHGMNNQIKIVGVCGIDIVSFEETIKEND